ncbi:MAG: DNA/RNA nuclease SfsA [Desulfitobacteriaceae bacterium]|nr:DNA/RNA nuclease SfsA [Desulfitobacteriaceae bacterium]MDD4753210.1 DNA/RNA nuclease SfsA [Desulfitobacteriaceae bacterium]
MQYANVKKGIFLRRPNRFIAIVNIDGRNEMVHVRNTGRCMELLIPGTPVIVVKAENPNRKTKFSLVAVNKGERLINIDSTIPNDVIYEGIQADKVKDLENTTELKREVSYKNSRFDIFFESRHACGFVEVKGVTLEKDNIALFPDAPTVRGTKHVYEMIDAFYAGYRGYILFLIQMKDVRYFTPNREMDPLFSKALTEAKEAGVKILAYDSLVTENTIILGDPVETKI